MVIFALQTDDLAAVGRMDFTAGETGSQETG